MSGAKGEGDLSPRLAELAKPALRSASPARQAAALSLAVKGAGSLVREGKRVVVEVRFKRGTVAGLDGLSAAGGRIVNVKPSLPDGDRGSRAWRAARARCSTGCWRRHPGPDPDCSRSRLRGAVRSEGDGQLNVASVRSAFAVDVSGVTVGILSDSFNRDSGAATYAGSDVASGDLPGPGSPCGSAAPVNLLDDSDAEGADEGRAMAQVVHDLAPGANLAFASATALNSQFAFAANIRALKAGGASVLTDDVFYPEEPFFQDGPVAVAIDEVTSAGAAYFSAAGNDNVVAGGKDVGSWEAEFQKQAPVPRSSPNRRNRATPTNAWTSTAAATPALASR